MYKHNHLSKIQRRGSRLLNIFNKSNISILFHLTKGTKLSNSGSEDDYKQIFLVKGKKKVPKEAEKDQDHSVIKDLIINEKEPILKTDNQDIWEFEGAEEFFKQKNQPEENIPDNNFKF